MLVPCYWEPQVGTQSSIGIYWTQFSGSGTWTCSNQGNLTGTIMDRVALSPGSFSSGSKTDGILSHPNWQGGELPDATAYWKTFRDNWNPSTKSYSGVNMGQTDFDLNDNGKTGQQMDDVAEGLAHLVNLFHPTNNNRIRDDNYSPYPQAHHWTLEQYSCHTDTMFSRSAWYTKHSESDLESGNVDDLSVTTTQITATPEPAFGDPYPYDGTIMFSYFPCFKTRMTLNRYPEGQVLCWADFNVAFSGNCELKAPSTWDQAARGDSYFITSTVPQARGSSLQIATAIEAYQVSFTMNKADHNFNGPYGAMLTQAPSNLALSMGPSTVLDFHGSNIDGARYAAARTGLVEGAPGALTSGLTYIRFGSTGYKVEKSGDDYKFELNHDNGNLTTAVALSEFGQFVQCHSDLRIGRYYHGGRSHTDRIRFRSPKW